MPHGALAACAPIKSRARGCATHLHLRLLSFCISIPGRASCPWRLTIHHVRDCGCHRSGMECDVTWPRRSASMASPVYACARSRCSWSSSCVLSRDPCRCAARLLRPSNTCPRTAGEPKFHPIALHHTLRICTARSPLSAPHAPCAQGPDLSSACL